MKNLLLIITMLFLVSKASGQAVINEFTSDPTMYDGTGGEWVELYCPSGTCDIACYTITDGQGLITIPAGTPAMAAGEFFLIARSESFNCFGCDFFNAPIDLDLSTCNCLSGGSYSVAAPGSGSAFVLGAGGNCGEFVLLFDAATNLVDGYRFDNAVCAHLGINGGTMTSNGAPLVGCLPETFDIPGSSDVSIPNVGAAIIGCNSSYARTTDGGATWGIENHPTPGGTNLNGGNEAFEFQISLDGGNTWAALPDNGAIQIDNCEMLTPYAFFRVVIENYQRLTPTIYDLGGKLGSFVHDINSGITYNWANFVGTGSGDEEAYFLTPIMIPLGGEQSFLLKWSDYKEGCCGSNSIYSTNECYEQVQVTITNQPSLVSAAVACTDAAAGVNVVTVSPANGNYTYELFDNGVLAAAQANNTFYVNSGTGPWTVNVINNNSCADTLTLSANICVGTPACPVISYTQERLLDLTVGSEDTCGKANPKTTAELIAGDIAFTGMNCDNPDQYSFVLLTDVAAGASINFTDRGWLSGGGFLANESGLETWTACTDLSAGTQITINSLLSGLSTDGDQLIAFTGSIGAPVMIAAINNEGAAVWQANATSSNTSALPAGLINGTTANAVTETDNVRYNCAVINGDRATLLAAINNPVNWSLNNATPFVLGNCDFSVTPDPYGPCVSCASTQEITAIRVTGQNLPVGSFMKMVKGDAPTFDPYTDGEVVDSIAINFTPSTQSSVVLNEVGIRPTTGDAGAGGEYVELLCPTLTPCNLSGFRVSDGDNFNYTIPDNTIVAGGDYLVLGGVSTPNVDLIVSGGALNNTGEQVYVFDCSGVFVTGVRWLGGQSLPANILTPAVCQIPAQSVTLNAAQGPDVVSYVATDRSIRLNAGTWVSSNADGTPGAANVGGDGTLAALGNTCAFEQTEFNLTANIDPADCGGDLYYKVVIDPLPSGCAQAEATSETFAVTVTCPTVAFVEDTLEVCADAIGLVLIDISTTGLSNGFYTLYYSANGVDNTTNVFVNGSLTSFVALQNGTYVLQRLESTNPLETCVAGANDSLFVNVTRPISFGDLPDEIQVCEGASGYIPGNGISEYLWGFAPMFAFPEDTAADFNTPIVGPIGSQFYIYAQPIIRSEYTGLVCVYPSEDSVLITSVPCPDITPLPVELLTFTAFKAGTGVSVRWTTATELNSDYFVVQRSHDGLTFEAIGTVQAAGHALTNRNYTFQDEHPLQGMNYYRLLAVDQDGSEGYSQVVAVRFERAAMGDFAVLPNPTSGSMTVVFGQAVKASSTLTLLDFLGRTVMVEELKEGVLQHQLDLSNLPAGMYYLALRTAGQVVATIPVVKAANR